MGKFSQPRKKRSVPEETVFLPRVPESVEPVQTPIEPQDAFDIPVPPDDDIYY